MLSTRALMLAALACSALACSTPGPDDPMASEGEAQSEAGSTASETETDTSAETGGPLTCASADACASDEWCDFPDDLCGAGMDGLCLPRPESCPSNEHYACGCDDEPHFADCEAVAGVDRHATVSACAGAAGLVPCGDRLCDVSRHYCMREASDVSDEPDHYYCVDYPSGCNLGDCDCLIEKVPCGYSCAVVGEGVVLDCAY